MDILVEDVGESLWAAAADKNRLCHLEVDPSTERVRYGSIYWAQVKRIDASMDAAFLDLDGENTGILYNRDTRQMAENGQFIKGGDQAIGKTLASGDMVLVQARTSYLPHDADEDLPSLQKTPIMTMDVAIHGRYLIHTPMDPKSRTSRRISDKKLKDQLERMVDDLMPDARVILRKAGAHTQTDFIKREVTVLHTVFETIKKSAIGQQAHLIMLGPDAVQRVLADTSADRIDHIDITTLDQIDRIQEWCRIFAPDLIPKIRRVDVEDESLSEDLVLFMSVPGIMDQIDGLLEQYVVLPGGGNIIIQETAALIAIDINSGPDRRGALAVNLEAAKTIAHHIHLRNLGGIILIDFLKMSGPDLRRKVMDELRHQFDDDPCTVDVHGFTRLGLLELTRHRRTPTFMDRIGALS